MVKAAGCPIVLRRPMVFSLTPPQWRRSRAGGRPLADFLAPSFLRYAKGGVAQNGGSGAALCALACV